MTHRVAGALHPVHDAVEGYAIGIVGVDHVEGVKTGTLVGSCGRNDACTQGKHFEQATLTEAS